MSKSKLPPIVKTWREQAKKRRRDEKRQSLTSTGGQGIGISFQLPPGWGEGVKGIRHIQSGKFKGRVCWSSRREAHEIAKIQSDIQGRLTLYDP